MAGNETKRDERLVVGLNGRRHAHGHGPAGRHAGGAQRVEELLDGMTDADFYYRKLVHVAPLVRQLKRDDPLAERARRLEDIVLRDDARVLDALACRRDLRVRERGERRERAGEGGAENERTW